MANKTVYVKIPSLSGTAGLTLILTRETSGTIANGSGDTLTAGSNGLFSCVVTEAITGWFDVHVKNGSAVVWEVGKLYIEVDLENDYAVDSRAQIFGLLEGDLASTIIDIESSLGSIETDTQDIQNTSALVKTQTDKLTFDGSNRVSANVTAMAANTLTASALAADAIAEIAATVTGVVVLPVAGSVTSAVDGTNITLRTNATTTITVSTSADLSAKTLRIVAEDETGTDVFTVANGSITKTSNTIAFSITSGSVVRELQWACRDVSNGEAYLVGSMNIKHAAN